MGKSTIFRGTVLERTLIDDVQFVKQPDGKTMELHGGGRYRVRFAVQETFSGQPRQEMTVYTNAQGSACGFPFEDGAEYVVFTYADAAKGELWTTHCSRTAKLTAGVENPSITWMRGWWKAPSGSEVSGGLLLPHGSPQLTVPATVTLEGAAQRTLTVDENGHYAAKGLPAGDYTLTARVPEGFSTQPARKLTLADKGCSQVQWYVSYEGHIRGRVLDLDGRPVADLPMRLERTDGDPQNRGTGLEYASTDLDGRYDFKWVPPGNFAVLVKAASSLTAETTSTIYYPHSPTLEGARPIALAASATRDDVNFTLARVLSTLPVKVRVVLPDGSSAGAGLLLYAFENGSRSEAPMRTAPTDTDGWATLPLFAGREYAVSVALDSSHAPCGYGLTFVAKDAMGPQLLPVTKPEACRR